LKKSRGNPCISAAEKKKKKEEKMKKTILKIVMILLVLIMGYQTLLHASAASQEEQNMAVVKRIFEVFKTKDPAVLDQLLSPELATSSKRVLNHWWKQYTEVNVTLTDIFASKNAVVLRWTLQGINDRELGEDWTFNFVGIFYLLDGKVVNMVNMSDAQEVLMKHGFTLKPPLPKTLEQKLKTTMGDMKTIGLVVSNYSEDLKHAPKAETIKAFAGITQPFYIKTCPLEDGWGNRLLYKFDKKNPMNYWVASAGSDEKFDGFDQKGTWDPNNDKGQDIVFFNGKFVYGPKKRVEK
jgi:flagellar basal body-associated protein FliL